MPKKDALPLIDQMDYLPLDARKLTQETVRRYGYGVAEYNGQKVQVAPYTDEKGRTIGQKLRTADKDFRVVGTIPGDAMFGKQLLRGSGKMVVITEGEIDAMSAAQALGGSWPCVSVPHGAQSAVTALKANLEVLESYEKVVICFDNDEPGQVARDSAVELFSPGKARLVDLGSYKDANDALKSDPGFLRNAIWDAAPWRPDGVVNMAELKERIKAPLVPGTPYPWDGLNRMLYGARKQELVTWTAGTGVGKTAIVSELVHHLVEQGKTVGIIYLEEGVDRAGKRIVGIHMNLPLHLPGQEYTDEEFDAAWDATLGTGRLYAYDHFGSLNEDILMNRIRYMVKGLGCDVVVLDHISMVVSGADLEADERRLLDHAMTTMRTLTQETNATFHVVSHLKRKEGRSHEEGGKVSLSHLRGTQAIAQLSDAVIGCERDQQDDDAEASNTTVLRVLKNRYAGITGVACALLFDHKTGRLTEIDEAVDALGGTPDADF
jgi:twinkle protein